MIISFVWDKYLDIVHSKEKNKKCSKGNYWFDQVKNQIF